MTLGKAKRAASLYGRWHKGSTYVLENGPGEYSWTAAFRVDELTVVLPPNCKVVAEYIDGVAKTAALFMLFGSMIHHSLP